MPATFKIKNKKLALIALICFCLFISLGYWQLSRAKEKKILLKSFTARTSQHPLNAQALRHLHDLRFYQTTLTGTFDNQHSFLLDNKIFHGRVGYEVFTPFLADGLSFPLLVDRGFIPMGVDRNTLPLIRPIRGVVTITGLINLPPAYVHLGQHHDSSPYWPRRIEYVNLNELSMYLNTPLFPYIVNLAVNDPAAYLVEWQIVTMGPEKHTGYAIQWFAFALTLLILFVALNREKLR